METSIPKLQERIREAVRSRTALRIRAGGSKDFYGNTGAGELLDPRSHRGIVAHEPTELVITARAGTPLVELEEVLEASGQMLAFEPPHFGANATLGGCVAAGLSGPRRAAAGALRDFVLGVKLLSGRAEVLRFGGTAMKNVAGYDVSRLLAGSLGTLGVILEVSLKVLPKPELEATLRFEMDEAAALRRMNELGGQPLPISASAWRDGGDAGAGILHIRLSGSRPGVESACARLGGERLDEESGAAFWQGLREHSDPFFATKAPLWRLGLPSSAAAVGLEGARLTEWGGAQRWLHSQLPAAEIRKRAQALGGHATLFRGGDRREGVFTPLSAPVMAIHRRLKAEFDPAGILNPGRMYPDF